MEKIELNNDELLKNSSEATNELNKLIKSLLEDETFKNDAELNEINDKIEKLLKENEENS